jgi:hypothetical protein
MKRILIAAVVAAFAITGCGKEEPKGPSTPTPQVTPPAPAPADAKKDEVKK